MSKNTAPAIYLFNLIVCCVDHRKSPALTDAVNFITSRFPCKTIVVEAESYEEASRWEIIPCDECNKEDQEPLMIRASGEELKRIPFAILSNLVADLPIYILYSSDPQNDQTGMLASFIKIASRLIFDSDSIPDIQKFSQRYSQLLKSSVLDIVDMNWTQITGWRQLLSRIFHTEELVNKLQKETLVRITYNIGEKALRHPEIQAIYLQAWFALRLGWKLTDMTQREDITHFVYKTSEGDDSTVELCPELAKGCPEGGIVGMEVDLSDKREFAFRRKPGTAKIAVHISFEDQCDLPFEIPFPSLNRGYQFFQEVFYWPTSDDYKEVLKIIGSKTISKQPEIS